MSYDDKEYVRNRNPGEIEISKRLSYGDGDLRYASMRMEDSNGYVFVEEKDEIVLRKTPKGARQLKVKFLEIDRRPSQLVLQFFNDISGKPRAEGSFPLRVDEIPVLLKFLEDLKRVHLTPGRLTVEPGALEHDQFTDDALISAIRNKPDLAAEIVKSNATSHDVKALGYRKKALELFDSLLTDQQFFDEQIANTPSNSAERVWQDFFENNQWIFGYGLSYVFLSSVDPEKLKNAVAGYSLAWKGKEPDAVMNTHGAVNSLCLIEIKTHRSDLTVAAPARSGSFGPSRELADAISQIQSSVAAAEMQLRESFQPVSRKGEPLSNQIYNYQPKSYVVIGSLSKFKTEHGINQEKFASFELFRRNVKDPEIITFDELFSRAKFIVDNAV